MKLDFDCIIIGGGVSGMTAALYLKRAGINVLLIEKKYLGGQIINAVNIQNYPGYNQIDGYTLTNKIEEQLKELDVNIIYDEVLNIEHFKNYQKINIKNASFFTKTIILAIGRQPKKLNIDKEDKLTGKGISYCATCDGSLYKDRIVSVVGAGNTAMEDAIYLSQICKKVYLINRGNQFLKADKILENRIKSISNIEIILNESLKELVEENDALTNIVLKSGKTIESNGLFVAIGSYPAKLNIKKLKMKEDYIIVNNKMETNLNGIYACGDIIYKDLYQIITAESEGAIAANSAKKYLLER